MVPMSLSEVLVNAKLSHHESGIRELGCVVSEDLKELEEADLVELGMKRVEVRRLLRIAATV